MASGGVRDSGARSSGARIRAAVSHIAWYVTAMMGDDAYRKYRDHYLSVHDSAHNGDAAGHAGPALMTEREFWRDHTDRQDSNPQGRCC